MNLFDPLRPKLPNSRPTWLRNHVAIPHFEISPLQDGNLKLGIFLPIRDSTFASMRFETKLLPDQFLDFLQNFTLDPEQTCETLFQHMKGDLSPELRNNIRFEPDYTDQPEIKTSSPKKQPKQKFYSPIEY